MQVVCRAGGLALFYASATGKVGESWNGLNSWAQVIGRRSVQKADDLNTVNYDPAHASAPVYPE